MDQITIKAAAKAHAKTVLGLDAFEKNTDAVNSICSDFLAGAEWRGGAAPSATGSIVTYLPGKEDLAEGLGIREERFQEIDKQIRESFATAQARGDAPLDALLAGCAGIPQNGAEAFLVGYLVGVNLNFGQQPQMPEAKVRSSLILPPGYE